MMVSRLMICAIMVTESSAGAFSASLPADTEQD